MGICAPLILCFCSRKFVGRETFLCSVVRLVTCGDGVLSITRHVRLCEDSLQAVIPMTVDSLYISMIRARIVMTRAFGSLDLLFRSPFAVVFVDSLPRRCKNTGAHWPS